MNILIFLAGGTGSRMNMGTLPKQYLLYRNRPIFSYALKTFNDHSLIEKIVIVASPDWQPSIDSWMKKERIRKFYTYALPGENRQLSILNGLKAVEKITNPEDVVIIHDSARPLVSAELITSCLTAIKGHEGVLPVLPVKDTFYLVDQDKKVAQLLPRAQVVAGQAPEAFQFGKYLHINESLSHSDLLKINGSTEIAVQFDLDIVTVPGEEQNFKITTQDDLNLMQIYLEGNNK